MRLLHYSNKPLSRVRKLPLSYNRGAYKTSGLWVSVEGKYDWVWWCESQGYNLDRFRYATEIILVKDANVKYLRDARDLDRFTARFHSSDKPIWDANLDRDRIRGRWNGLIIAPYVHSRRLTQHTSWYYGWDCASGVIWNPQAVASLRMVPAPNLAARKV